MTDGMGFDYNNKDHYLEPKANARVYALGEWLDEHYDQMQTALKSIQSEFTTALENPDNMYYPVRQTLVESRAVWFALSSQLEKLYEEV